MTRKRLIRVKKRLLREAVEENVLVMRGLNPYLVRQTRHRLLHWTRISALLFVPLGLLGSSHFLSSGEPANRAAVIGPAVIRPSQPSVRMASMAAPMFAAPSPMTSEVLPLAVRRVVLDAGHGGSDPGATRPTGLIEKDLTLDIGMRLRKLLEEASFEVALTREADLTLPLNERTRLANAAAGDIFISIHVNTIRSPRYRGVQTYYLGPTDDPLLTKIAAAENRSSGYSLADLRKLLEGIYADVREKESKKLAQVVQAQLHGTLRSSNPSLENWGVRTAPFVVLVGTEMPAILAEVSCLSNESEAGLLRSESYRQQIAQALFLGIRSYAEAHDDSRVKGI